MKRLPLLLGLLLVSAVAPAAPEVAPTVGRLTENNGLSAHGWLLVRTPSILQVTDSAPVTPDLRLAIEQYDQLQELPADPAIHAEALRRSADLRLRIAEGSGAADPVELGKAVRAYRRLLAEQPDYPRADRVLYQLARASELLGDEAQSIASLRQLGRQYPQSARRADAQFRAAELLYRDRRYAEAEGEYRQVVALGAATPLFEPAQFKYGWSLLQQGRHEQALPVFLAVLERELPPGELSDPQGALAAVQPGRAELAGDALRAVGLSLAALGGGPALNAQFARDGTSRFAALIHAALGEQLLHKRRYTEAAGSYLAFIARQPRHVLAPEFQRRAMAVYQQGGFTELLLGATETYVSAYALGAAYWGAAAPPAAVQAQVRKDLEDLGRHYQATAQRGPAGAARPALFLKAAGHYQRWLELYPREAQAPAIHLLLADALHDGGRADEAARQYARVAYDYAPHAAAAEAAYAAVQAWQQHAAGPARAAALRQSVAAGQRLAETFPQHPQRAAVLARAAADLYELGDHAQAVALAQRVMDGSPSLPPELSRRLLGITADARYAQRDYAAAEAAYAALLQQIPAGDAARAPATEQLAASIYRQAEAARAAGELRAAATAFQRVGRAAPEASIRASADYDAAAALMALQDWPQAQAALEAFRARYPAQPLLPEVDKKLALAYQRGGKPAAAAPVYARIAGRSSEAPALRRDAAWLAAELYGEARQLPASQRAYEDYLAQYPQPLEPALLARRRLADAARDADRTRHARWLRELVDAEAGGGAARTPQTRLLAAQASLELGRLDAAQAQQLALRLPVAKTLSSRQAATERAIVALNRAAGYGFAEVTTAATYDLGGVYRDLGRALLASERPRELQGESLEQYELLLEEQAYPFEDKAIQAHEANLQRLRQGLWNDWIRRSSRALAELAPGKYGKQDQREVNYDALR